MRMEMSLIVKYSQEDREFMMMMIGARAGLSELAPSLLPPGRAATAAEAKGTSAHRRLRRLRSGARWILRLEQARRHLQGHHGSTVPRMPPPAQGRRSMPTRPWIGCENPNCVVFKDKKSGKRGPGWVWLGRLKGEGGCCRCGLE